MCLETLGRILEIGSDDKGVPVDSRAGTNAGTVNSDSTALVNGTTLSKGTAIVDVEGVARRVSLAVLNLEGTSVVPGDWILCHTGLALRVLTDTDARNLLMARNAMYASLSAEPQLSEERLRDEGDS